MDAIFIIKIGYLVSENHLLNRLDTKITPLLLNTDEVFCTN
jgi:hypothetical protein